MNDWTVDTGEVDALVAGQHGQWFDFNDRKVQYSTARCKIIMIIIMIGWMD